MLHPDNIAALNTIEPTPKDSACRACVQVFDNMGNLVQRTYGHSPSEMQDLHNAHRCDYLCPICYEEAMATLEMCND